ncbi:37045_t:CDS:2, partial [Racocetra persica]
GINCYDVFKEEYFILRAVIVNWSGDTLRLTKLIGVCTNHIYYPTTPPSNFNSKRYCPANLPNRTHKEWKEKLKKICKAKSEKSE